jgi:hypothetical protein
LSNFYYVHFLPPLQSFASVSFASSSSELAFSLSSILSPTLIGVDGDGDDLDTSVRVDVVATITLVADDVPVTRAIVGFDGDATDVLVDVDVAATVTLVTDEVPVTIALVGGDGNAIDILVDVDLTETDTFFSDDVSVTSA